MPIGNDRAIDFVVFSSAAKLLPVIAAFDSMPDICFWYAAAVSTATVLTLLNPVSRFVSPTNPLFADATAPFSPPATFTYCFVTATACPIVCRYWFASIFRPTSTDISLTAIPYLGCRTTREPGRTPSVSWETSLR